MPGAVPGDQAVDGMGGAGDPTFETPAQTGSGDISRKTMKGMGVLLGSSVVRAVLRVVVAGIFARLIDPSQFGIAAAAGIFVGLARTVAVSGIVQTLVQRPQLTEEEIRTAFTANMVAAVVTTLAMCACAPLITGFMRLPGLTPVLYVASLSFPLIAISGVSSKLLERDHNFGVIAWSDVISYIVAYIVFGLPLALIGQGVWALIVPAVLANLVQSVILTRYQPHSLRPGFSWATYRELMRTGTGYSLQRYVNIIATKGDYFVVGRLLGSAALGMYERAYVLMDVSNQLIMTSLATALFPAFARIQHDLDRMRRAFLRSMALITLMFLPASAVLVALGPEVVRIMIGPKWGGAVLPFQILIAGLFFRNAYRIPATVLNAMAKVRITSASQVAYALTVVGGAWFGSRWGIAGVALGVLVAITVHLSIMTVATMRILSITPGAMGRAMAPGAGFTVMLGVPAWALGTGLRAAGVPALALAAAVGLAIGAIALVAIRLRPGLLGEYGKDIVRPLVVRLHGMLEARHLPTAFLPPLARLQ